MTEIQQLVDQGANPTQIFQEDDRQNSALLHSVSNPQVVAILLTSPNCDIDQMYNDCTALYFASCICNPAQPETVKLLLKKGANTFIKNSTHFDVLQALQATNPCSNSEEYKICQLIEEHRKHGAALIAAAVSDEKDDVGNPTGFFDVFGDQTENNTFNPCYQDDQGRTPLMCAIAHKQNLVAANFLSVGGSPVNHQDLQHQSALTLVAKEEEDGNPDYNNLKVVDELLKAGADPDPKDANGASVLPLDQIPNKKIRKMIADKRQANSVSVTACKYIGSAAMLLAGLLGIIALCNASTSYSLIHFDLSDIVKIIKSHPSTALACILAAVLVVISLLTAASVAPTACCQKPAKPAP